MIPALIFPYIFDTLDLYYFPILLLISFIGCILGTLMTKPTDMETLKSFYKTVKPWGFWGPVHDQVVADDPDFKANLNFKLDMFNVFVGIIGQTCLTLLPIYFVLLQWTETIIVFTIIVVCGFILKSTWWDKLKEEKIENYQVV